ncbi:hypothetical protein HELRODRAFT_62232 [Helobdella robusta]|uniref:Transmembrane protein 26 n=1 Tax=Helobdella robusta TaxID=6412 RepID=T1FWX4_HELRO|nr:hypothetical protein HELRODRAFT_62232 [Helobdella robusta]ESO13232.1 hypothetical protein HELRODRAFT_62232 [Helobdella robusta]
MGCFTVSRAITVRVLFTAHGVFSIWRLFVITNDPQNWYLLLALFGLAFETAFTLYVKRGEDWKWFCPSVFFYLACLVPTIWFLELHELNERIREHILNTTSSGGDETSRTTSSWNEMTTGIIGTSGFNSHQWIRTLEQLLLLILILGRWMLPKGKLTHDQLSQLLLVYIGTAADIVEFFEAFNEEQVKYNRTLCTVILAIWSWSVLQFTLVFTATKGRKESPAGVEVPAENCCTPDVFGIIMSIFMQDGPFLVLRMLLIFKYNVLSYTNMFFTCKNTLVCMLLTYRFVVYSTVHVGYC